MRPSQWSQDTAADEKWTTVDYTSCFLAGASLPREVPLMHTQEDFNRFVIKVAPEGSMQGFQIPYIGNFSNMEPCTLWGKFLLRGG